ncbi:MAG: hypothetical protein K2G46_04145, partial [Bacteroidales bacterium]|nr:hypothetical protein [Bacteroidales bacterium]
ARDTACVFRHFHATKILIIVGNNKYDVLSNCKGTQKCVRLKRFWETLGKQMAAKVYPFGKIQKPHSVSGAFIFIVLR